MDSSAAQQLIPGLIDDVALHCLAHASPESFPSMLRVCKLWESTVGSLGFYENRRRAGTTRASICLVQAIPAAPQEIGSEIAPPKSAAAAPPRYGLTLIDLATKSFERLPQIPEFPSGLPLFCQCVAIDGRVFIIGGWNPTTYQATRSLFSFDFSSRSWRRCSDMLSTRSFFACASASGRIFVAGGHDDCKNALASVEVYDASTDSWAEMPPMSEARDECRAVVVRNSHRQQELVVISGYGSDSQGDFLGSAEAIDLSCSHPKWRRIEDFWRRGDCPNAIAAAGADTISIDESGEVAVRSGDSWRRLTPPPQSGGARLCAAAGISGGAAFVAAQQDGGDGGIFFLLRPGAAAKSQWEALPCGGDAFRGVVQSQGACFVDI